MRTLPWAALPLSLVALAACGGSDPVSPPPPPPPPVGITVTPASATVGAAGTVDLTAAVTNATNTAVTWSATGGSVSGTGATVTWTAPPNGGTYTVTATSAADATKSASAALTVTPVSVTITPTAATLFRGEPAAFSAAVTGTGNGQNTVTWTVSCGTSAASASGIDYTAPSNPGTCTVTAASTVDPAATANATVTVRADWLVTSTADTDDGNCTYANCTLREALAAAQATPALDTIRLGVGGGAAPAAGAAAPELTGTILLTSALPAITTP
ncbi:MAG: CSLREA domain-containing protein, partial [Gemmatimonadales bacterium]